MAQLKDAIASAQKLPRELLVLFAGGAAVAGSHEPLKDGDLIKHAVRFEHSAAARSPHEPPPAAAEAQSHADAHHHHHAHTASSVHELTLVIDESGLEPTLSGAHRDVGNSAYVNAPKGEPLRHENDARLHN